MILVSVLVLGDYRSEAKIAPGSRRLKIIENKEIFIMLVKLLFYNIVM